MVEVIEERTTALEKIGMQDEWLQIRTPSGAEGYTAAWYYVIAETPEQPRLYITPANERVRIRSAPIDGDPLAIVRPGDVLKVMEPYREVRREVAMMANGIYVRSREGVEGYTNAGHYIGRRGTAAHHRRQHYRRQSGPLPPSWNAASRPPGNDWLGTLQLQRVSESCASSRPTGGVMATAT